MNELTISQVQRILEWSYPTALDFARVHGRQRDNGRAAWLVPVAAVEDVVKDEESKAAKLRRRFTEEIAGE